MNLSEKQGQNTVPYSIDGTDTDLFPVRRDPAVCGAFASDISAAYSLPKGDDTNGGGDDRPETYP